MVLALCPGKFYLGPGKFYGRGLPRPHVFTGDGERIDPPSSVTDPLLSWAHDTPWSLGGLCVRRVRGAGVIEGSIKSVRSEKEKSEKQGKKVRSENVKTEKQPKKTRSQRKNVEIRNVESHKTNKSDFDRSPMKSKIGEHFDLVGALDGNEDIDLGDTSEDSENIDVEDESDDDEESEFEELKKHVPDSPPPAHLAAKRRRFTPISLEGGDDLTRRGPVRKLEPEFDRIAEEAGLVIKSDRSSAIAERTRGRCEDGKKLEQKKGSKMNRKVLMKCGKKIEFSGMSDSLAGIRVSPRLAKIR